MAVFGAGFQLSFAATTGLVIWFEAWRHRAGQNNAGQDHAGQGAGPRPRVLRWAGDLILASLIASAATTPLTAALGGVYLAMWCCPVCSSAPFGRS